MGTIPTSLVGLFTWHDRFTSYLRSKFERITCKRGTGKSLKWTNFSKILINLIGQDNNSRRGLGCDKIKSSYNPQSKNVPDANNLLCENCGRDGNLKNDCKILEKIEWSSSNYSKQRKRAKERHVKFVWSEDNQEKKERGPALCAKFFWFDSNMEMELRDLVLVIVLARTLYPLGQEGFLLCLLTVIGNSVCSGFLSLTSNSCAEGRK